MIATQNDVVYETDLGPNTTEVVKAMTSWKRTSTWGWRGSTLQTMQARRMRFSLAADYLVMAAWLAYLKSRLLLPKPETKGAEPPAEELAATLAFRLAKLDAMYYQDASSCDLCRKDMPIEKVWT